MSRKKKQIPLWKINFILPEGSKEVLYYDLASLLEDLQRDLYYLVKESRLSTISKIEEDD